MPKRTACRSDAKTLICLRESQKCVTRELMHLLGALAPELFGPLSTCTGMSAVMTKSFAVNGRFSRFSTTGSARDGKHTVRTLLQQRNVMRWAHSVRRACSTTVWPSSISTGRQYTDALRRIKDTKLVICEFPRAGKHWIKKLSGYPSRLSIPCPRTRWNRRPAGEST